MEKAADALKSAAVTWPYERYAYVKFGYDRTIGSYLSSKNTNFQKWIDPVMTHVQSYYYHDTLPTRIKFKYDHAKTLYRDEDLPSTKSLYTWSEYGQKDNDPKVD